MDRQTNSKMDSEKGQVSRQVEERERGSMSSLVLLFIIVTGDWSDGGAVPHTRLADTHPLQHHMSASCVPSTPQHGTAVYGQTQPTLWLERARHTRIKGHGYTTKE